MAGREGELGTSKWTFVLYSSGVLTPGEGTLSIELQDKGFGVYFDFVHTFVADDIL